MSKQAAVHPDPQLEREICRDERERAVRDRRAQRFAHAARWVFASIAVVFVTGRIVSFLARALGSGVRAEGVADVILSSLLYVPVGGLAGICLLVASAVAGSGPPRDPSSVGGPAARNERDVSGGAFRVNAVGPPRLCAKHARRAEHGGVDDHRFVLR